MYIDVLSLVYCFVITFCLMFADPQLLILAPWVCCLDVGGWNCGTSPSAPASPVHLYRTYGPVLEYRSGPDCGQGKLEPEDNIADCEQGKLEPEDNIADITFSMGDIKTLQSCAKLQVWSRSESSNSNHSQPPLINLLCTR